MDVGLFAQYVMNGLMLGMMYALVAVGFTLFFGVLDVIKFSHGDVLTVGAFTALATFAGLNALGFRSQWLDLVVMLVIATLAMAVLGMLIARYLVMPLRSAPALNTLLITLMLGTVLRESVRLFYPQGANPKPFPALLPRSSIDLGSFNLRLDNVLMLAAGVAVIVGLQFLLNRTKLGLAIRAVAQDEETARTMGVNFTAIVLVTFAIGSGLAAFAGVMNGLYYNEINFGIGLYLGVIGFSAAIIGGLGSIYGAILGGFLFAGLQTIGTVLLPFASAYKDVFAFAVVIAIMAWRPTGLIREKSASGCEPMANRRETRAPALWPGLIALAAATVYLIALLAAEKQALIISLLAFGIAAVDGRRLVSASRRRQPLVCRSRGCAGRLRRARGCSPSPRSSTRTISSCCW